VQSQKKPGCFYPPLKLKAAFRNGIHLSSRLVSILLAALIGFSGLHAVPALSQTVRFFNGQSGLSDTSRSLFAQNSDGFFYIGNKTGLYVSSGGEFTRVDKPDGSPFKDIEAIAGGADGSILIAADKELWLKSRTGFEKIPFRFDGRISLAADGMDFIILSGEGPARNGGIWRLYRHQKADTAFVSLVKDHADSLVPSTNPLKEEALSALTSDAKTVWIGCGVALCRYRDGGVDTFDERRGVPREVWRALVIAPDGSLIARSAGKFLIIAANGGVHVEDIPYELPEYFREKPSEIFLLRLTDGAFLTPGHDSLVVRSATGHWDDMDWPSSYSPQTISSAYIDREYGLWLDSPGRGPVRIAGFPFWKVFFTDHDVSPLHVSGVRHDAAGNLWIAAENGLFEYAASPYGHDGEHLLKHIELENITSLIRTGDGALWTAEKGKGLIRIDPVTGQVRTLPSSEPVTGALVLDSGGRIWVGTVAGLVRVDDPLRYASHLPTVFSLQNHRINALCFDQFGRLLVLTDSVLFQQTAEENVFEPRVDLENFAIGDASAMTVTMSNDVWVLGTKGNARKIFLPEDGSPVVSMLDDGPKNSGSTTIFRDSRGWIWLGGSHGLDVSTPNGWSHFDLTNGLASSRILPGSINEDDDGSLWFGTENGLNHLREPGSLPVLPDLHTNFLSAHLDNVDLLGGEQFWPDGERKLSLQFIAPTFTGNREIKYQYQLAGIDHEPGYSSTNFVNYYDVKGEKIVFQVQAQDLLNYRSASSAILSVRSSGLKVSGFKGSWWALFSFLLVMLLGAILYRRIKLLRQKNFEAAVRGRTRVMEEMQTQLLHQSRVDSLTGLLNRRSALDELDELVASISSNELIAVALIDIDHFKMINDTLGHQGGDFVLEQYGQRLRKLAGAMAICGRYGGEELIVAFMSVSCTEELLRQVTRLHEHLRKPMIYGASEVVATCSIGLAVILPGDTTSKLIGRADRALYRGKKRGRNCIVVAD
jgi:diguanylate cyclase (GGDEF)-like protein